jgi:cytochrome c oxidase subunit 2
MFTTATRMRSKAATLTTTIALAFAASCLMSIDPASAEQGLDSRWQVWHSPPVTPIAEQVDHLHRLMFILMFAITALVVVLLLYALFRFHASRHPVPSRRSHNTVIEIAWTILPVIVLVVIAIPSFRALYFRDRTENPDMTLKAIGNQWYWDYEYPDYGNFRFSSLPIAEADLQPGQPRLLAVDNPAVVPVGAKVRLQTTAGDVIHSWDVPEFGLKLDAIPGRLNETWFQAKYEGVYYGECSEICGANHYFMPIMVRVVSQPEFAAWVCEAQAKFGATPPAAAEGTSGEAQAAGVPPC